MTALLPRHCAQNSPNDLRGVPIEKDAKSVIFGVPVQMREWAVPYTLLF